MKLYLISTFLLLICFASHAQKLKVEKRVTDHSIYVKGDGFEGVIFDANYDFINMRGYRRFTPKAEDIIKIEYILNSKLKQVTDKNDQDSIYINLKYYMRQYIGLINAKGEKGCFRELSKRRIYQGYGRISRFGTQT